jgi:hypothetical protein
MNRNFGGGNGSPPDDNIYSPDDYVASRPYDHTRLQSVNSRGGEPLEDFGSADAMEYTPSAGSSNPISSIQKDRIIKAPNTLNHKLQNTYGDTPLQLCSWQDLSKSTDQMTLTSSQKEVAAGFHLSGA